MKDLKIPDVYKRMLGDFSRRLQEIYSEQLLSLSLYGSAAGGEFISKRSRLDVLVVLKNTDLAALDKAGLLLRKYSRVNALFLTLAYINSSLDVFPVEFLDMRENYAVIHGEDVLKDLRVDLRNLRFQCEHELKGKLIGLKQGYLKNIGNNLALQQLLLVSFSSFLHVLRNIFRLDGVHVPYLKSEVIGQLALRFHINQPVWQRILSLKNKPARLNVREVKELFGVFTADMERIIDTVDKI